LPISAKAEMAASMSPIVLKGPMLNRTPPCGKVPLEQNINAGDHRLRGHQGKLAYNRSRPEAHFSAETRAEPSPG
jgi:hypothetical protein